MGNASARQWESLERWSPTLFLLAGVLLIAYAALNGLAAFSDGAYVLVEDIVGPAGFVLGFVGLLGLYPGVVDRDPTLARAGTLCVSLGAIGFTVITLQGLAVVAGVESVGGPGIFLLLVTIGLVPGYLLFGVASLRADMHSRTVGLLLFVPAVVYATMLSQAILFVQFGVFSETTMAWSAFAISSSQAMAHLSIGYTLRIGGSSDDREAPSADVTVS